MKLQHIIVLFIFLFGSLNIFASENSTNDPKNNLQENISQPSLSEKDLELLYEMSHIDGLWDILNSFLQNENVQFTLTLGATVIGAMLFQMLFSGTVYALDKETISSPNKISKEPTILLPKVDTPLFPGSETSGGFVVDVLHWLYTH